MAIGDECGGSFKILDFFRHNDILLHLVSTVLEDKYEIYIENIREMQRDGVPSKFSRNTKENEAIQINGVQGVRNSMKNEKGAVVDQKELQFLNKNSP
ncbi:uncharacterized protein LOC103941616 isoform X2 [Pyrus x bretschneideri]|uniref:uncharacterized protein LOC103941616 isoform X2 n=1 Tax=Pyrus x bretschneideri TaxID=225117 RepID=UPI00203034FC|nr:uncharacterized protein LOC103941616 isoform X2 [Pyrus x bretschneideri]